MAVWNDPLPPKIVVDETWVKVSGRDCWIFAAIDPKTWRVTYVEPHFKRDGKTTEQFFQHIAEIYGEWPYEVITDGGSWYRMVLPIFVGGGR